MPNEVDQQASQLAERLRHAGPSASATALVAAATEMGLAPTFEVVHKVVSLLRGRHTDAGLPDCALQVVAEVLSAARPESLLDPNCGYGALLLPVAAKLGLPNITGVTHDEWSIDLATTFGPRQARWYRADPMDWVQSCEERFDAVVCFPPVGMRPEVGTVMRADGEIELRAERGHLLLLRSTSLLTDKGIGLYVVPSAFFRRACASDIRTVLESNGWHMNSFAVLPRGSVLGTSVEFGLLCITCQPSVRLWVGEVPEDDRRRDQFVANLLARRPGKDVALGCLVDPAQFQSFEDVHIRARIDSMASQCGVPAVPLAEVVTSVNRATTRGQQPFDSHPNAVYLPEIHSARGALTLEECPGGPKHCLQLVLDPSRALAPYVVRYYNSALGTLVRKGMSSGAYRPHLRKDDLAASYLHLPSLAIQQQVIDADSRIDAMTNELAEFRDQLWQRPAQAGPLADKLTALNRPDSFPDWLETLPFPVASVLWAYHTSDRRPELRVKHLLHFFEALSAFQSAVLVSALRRDEALFATEWQSIAGTLRQQKLSLGRATFGVWNVIVGRLAKTARKLLNEPSTADDCASLFGHPDPARLAQILASPITSALQQANNLRNDFDGHGGAMGQHRASAIETELYSLVEQVRSSVGLAWTSYQLVRAGECRFQRGTYHYSARRVMGTRSQFEQVAIALDHALEDGELYLHAPSERNALQLIPFVRMLPSPETEENACYFYSRTEAGQRVRVVSYHFEAQSDRTEVFEEISSTVKSLEVLGKEARG